MAVNVRINHEQKCYIITSDEAVSCLGFENCYKKVVALARRLNCGDLFLSQSQIGSMVFYLYYLELVKLGASHPAMHETWFDEDTPDKVQSTLEYCRKQRNAVRIFYGNTETGLSRLDEDFVVGHISLSTGPIRIPLLVPRNDDYGGDVSTASIVRIMDVKTGAELYRHPLFHLPELAVNKSNEKGYRFAVTADGVTYARFNKEKKALQWIEFMRGERMRT